LTFTTIEDVTMAYWDSGIPFMAISIRTCREARHVKSRRHFAKQTGVNAFAATQALKPW